MATSKPFQLPGESFTGRANGSIIGARFVKPHSTMGDGNFGVQAGTAAGAICGVAAQDATTGTDVLVWSGPGIITEVTAGEALTAGQRVEVGAAGVAMVLASGIMVGICMADTANAALAPIKLLH